MPVIKNALARYRVIDRNLRNEYNPFPSKAALRAACEEELFGTTLGGNICDSTVEKDLFAMRIEHDAPIKYSKQERGYYYDDKEYSIDEVPLTEKDVEAIKIAANLLSQFKNTEIFSQFEFAIDKIIDRVNISSNVQDTAIEEYVQFETVERVGGSEFLEPLLTAIKNKNKVQFEHKGFSSETTKTRRIHPYLLKEYRNRWYLIGKSELKDKVITFGLDRVANLVVLSDTYKKDDSFSPDMFFKYSIGITSNYGSPCKIIIETGVLLSKYILSQPLHQSQEHLGEKNNMHLFSYFLLPTYELKMQILGFGKDVKVVEPKELRAEIHQIATSVVSLYK
jgi:predicted DNA-binding transcriptional regulator YafY